MEIRSFSCDISSNESHSVIWFRFQKKMLLLAFTIQMLCGLAFSDCATTERILTKAFPGSYIMSNVLLFGDTIDSCVLVGISLLNKNAFVPFSKAQFIQFDNSVAVIAFEIYLYAQKVTIDELLTRKADNRTGNSKLLQLLFFNPKTNEIYGKPSGFPIEAQSWECGGDFCAIVHLVKLLNIQGTYPSCILYYSKSINEQYLQSFMFKKNSIKGSEKKLIGDLSGETGNTIYVGYSDIKELDGCVTATKKTICNGDSEVCKTVGFENGSKIVLDTLISCK